MEPTAGKPRLLDLTAAPEFDPLKDLYGIYRDYMKHEDDLINQRSTWHLLIQGFLFATFGVMGEWQLEAAGGYLHSERPLLVLILSGCGLLIALAALSSIIAANTAIQHLCSQWSNIKSRVSTDLSDAFPGLAGAGSDQAKRWGKLPAHLIPIFVAAAWGLILAMAIHDSINPPQASQTTMERPCVAPNLSPPTPPNSPSPAK